VRVSRMRWRVRARDSLKPGHSANLLGGNSLRDSSKIVFIFATCSSFSFRSLLNLSIILFGPREWFEFAFLSAPLLARYTRSSEPPVTTPSAKTATINNQTCNLTLPCGFISFLRHFSAARYPCLRPWRSTHPAKNRRRQTLVSALHFQYPPPATAASASASATPPLRMRTQPSPGWRV